MTAAPNKTGSPLGDPVFSMKAIITGPDFTFNPTLTEFFTLLLSNQSLYFCGRGHRFSTLYKFLLFILFISIVQEILGLVYS